VCGRLPHQQDILTFSAPLTDKIYFFITFVCGRVPHQHDILTFSSHLFVLHLAGFPTNKTELNAVFDIFDREKRGLIDYKDFVDALKPDKVHQS